LPEVYSIYMRLREMSQADRFSVLVFILTLGCLIVGSKARKTYSKA
jgi:hypothetical protein